MSWSYRCGRANCRKVVTFKKELHKFKVEKKCADCSGTLYLAWYHMEANQRKSRKSCNCECVHYPHRPGGFVLCIQHPTGPSEEEWKLMYGHSPV